MINKDHPFIICECGARIKSNSVYTHLKSKKHLEGKPASPKMKIIHGSVDVSFPGRCYNEIPNEIPNAIPNAIPNEELMAYSSDAKNVS